MKDNRQETYIMNYIAVHAFILNEAGETLVLQRSPTNMYKPLFWDIPGGKMLMDEDIEETAVREVLEECGLEVEQVGRPLSVFVNREQLPNRKDVQIVVACKVKDTKKPITLQPREHCSYRWISPQELPTIECMAYLKHFYQQAQEETK